MLARLSLGRLRGTKAGCSQFRSRPAALTAAGCIGWSYLCLKAPVHCSNQVTPVAPKPLALNKEVAQGDGQGGVGSPEKVIVAQSIAALLFRYAEVAFHLGPVIAWWLLGSMPVIGTFFSRERMLAMLVDALANCGPVGIKWGQWASTRFDIFDDDFCDTLGKLTNFAPAHSFEWSRECLETSFGRKLDDVFIEFDPEAVASGSIGQVHMATLRSDNSLVAVKVQHPNLAKRLALDMAILRQLAQVAAWLAPGWRISETADQFATNFEAQLDFRDEAENLRAFKRNFDSSFWRAIVSFPKPVEGLIAHDVLVESFESGESVANFLGRCGSRAGGSWHLTNKGWVMVGASEDDTSELRANIALCGIQSYFKMMIWDNLLHADLHPGNVLIRLEDVDPLGRLMRYIVLGDSSSRVPHIVFLDAGLAASFPQEIFAHIHSFFQAVVSYDGETIGKSILALGLTQPHVRSHAAFIEEVAQKCAAQKREYDAGGGKAGDNMRSYLESVRAHQVIIHPSVMVAVMSMLVLEGWQFRLDPAVSVFTCLESATGDGIFGYVSRLSRCVTELRGRLGL
uniref:ABC1 atypical kinase-like domain-containing protein n=1 Tax=Coccolithus braarudii TaxID=221442 RepID=A0A7S0LB18_9EUKA|mmetsp:Transcript_30499/g.65540  ORF Transcript_30499/g.65540 Transcript_30499/m.65540 type:complete len:569 (+) Transcript_30499:208-1914(+)|eukprot:CAMPEP_0183368394 /NCGR_PEP_ID=MMETSP0164_2-20130417/95754_1 /TAXON_ID=221442 /ORGANISM="Coccolithus pelagicus ssp braarudi, Strain PLY182g" /LENGTH=568 /DNA_ID=CAMNT_0025544479 /DNA_START=194 /DNA_END=1900 /DNA_ORIENTATION=-